MPIPVCIRPLLAALLALGPMACGRRPEAPFQVATNPWPGYAPLYLGRDLGLLDARKLRLLEMANATDALRALKAGFIPAATLTLDETFTLLQDGLDLRVVLVMDISCGADAILVRPGVKDLRGRRVGVEESAVGAYLLTRALDSMGLRPEDITVVPLTANRHEQAYKEGLVDAVVTFEPMRSRLLAAGAELLFDSRRIPNEIFDVLVVRAETARRSPEAVARLRRGWFEALAFLRQHPEEAAARMAPRAGLDARSLRASMEGLEFPDEAADQRLRAGGLHAPARRLAELMAAKRLLRRPVDLDRLFSTP